MKKLTVLFFAFVMCAMSAVSAPLIQTVSFQPTATVWLCPKGARYVLMECKPTEAAQPATDLVLQPVGEGNDFFQGNWEVQAPVTAGSPAVYQSVTISSFVHQSEGPILLINVSAGFDIDSARQSGVFMDVSQAGVPNQIMTTSDRWPLNEKQELVITFEMNEIKGR